MKVTLIHNPDAGSDEHTCEDPAELIRRAGHQLVYQSSKDGHWRSALDRPADLIAVAGGDGIVGTVAKIMIGRGT
jgi:diacylglycerol kinase family enzyme